MSVAQTRAWGALEAIATATAPEPVPTSATSAGRPAIRSTAASTSASVVGARRRDLPRIGEHRARRTAPQSLQGLVPPTSAEALVVLRGRPQPSRWALKPGGCPCRRGQARARRTGRACRTKHPHRSPPVGPAAGRVPASSGCSFDHLQDLQGGCAARARRAASCRGRRGSIRACQRGRRSGPRSARARPRPRWWGVSASAIPPWTA